MPEGVIAVADAMGVTDAGIFGDILCARMRKRNVAALVSDGVIRDLAGVLGTGLPVWCQGTAAPASVTGLTFVAWQQPVGCGGVAVFPNDVVVVDSDGAVVIRPRCSTRVVRRPSSRSARKAGSCARSKAAPPCRGCTR
jgi:regulator of RNase E activity RraA